MSDDTLIADLVRAGVPAELVGRVANAVQGAFQAGADSVRGQSADILAGRRDRDRARKQKSRELLRKNKGASKANDVAAPLPSSEDVSADSADNRCESFFLSSSESTGKEDGKRVTRSRARGSRLPDDWRPSDEDRAFALGQGMSHAQLATASAEFVDYWIGVPGQRGCKTDWPATWRNRVRELSARKKPNGKYGRNSSADAADDLIARAEGADRTLDLDRGDYEDIGVEDGERPRR